MGMKCLLFQEHINSTKEKREKFEEARVWSIAIQASCISKMIILLVFPLIALDFQLILALRYLHKEKRIVHRDLKPNNIMLTDSDRVVISKQNSYLLISSWFFSGLWSCQAKRSRLSKVCSWDNYLQLVMFLYMFCTHFRAVQEKSFSPEVVQHMPYGEKADIWSCGCCIYEVLSINVI